MNTKSSAMIVTRTALALAGFIWAGSTIAQDSEVISNMDRPADDVASCKAMQWNSELLGTHPWVVEGCHAVVIVNGEKWARFEGKYQRSYSDGSFDTKFNNTANRSLGTVTLTPEPGQRVQLDGQPTRFSDLQRDQVLSFYVPEGAMGFAVEPGVPHDQLVKYVETPREEMQEQEEPMQLAAAESRPARSASRLPATAGPLPLFALGGLMSMLGGLGLTLRRKAGKKNS
jgi:hypothetical protein